jgi:hypothetical protein
MAQSLLHLHCRITVTVTAVFVDMLSQECGEMEFSFDACRVASSAQTELH